MSANEIHENDIGTVFRVTIKDGDSTIDVSSATTKELVFKKPNGSTLTKTASFFTDGTDGIIQYASISGDLTPTGEWQLQAHLVLSGGTWRSDVGTFTVFQNL